MKSMVAFIVYLNISLACGGEVADYYYKQTTNQLNRAKGSLIRQPFPAPNHGISEIGIERTTCFGTCPAYTFIVKSNGSFRYKGVADVERTGEFTGKISVAQFNLLAQFILDSDYLGLENSYSPTITDCPTVYTTVVANGKRKVVSNYANGGPTKLWAIERLIDQLMVKAEWKPELPKAPEPVLPKVTRYDSDPVLRTAYQESFRAGYSDAWERKEKLPVSEPTMPVDKARIIGYGDGMIAGRAALATWFGTNSPSKK